MATMDSILDRLRGLQIPGNKSKVVDIKIDDIHQVFVISAWEFEFSETQIDLHLLNVEIPQTAFSATSIIEIYISKNGVELLELAKTIRKPKGAIEFIVFVEINRGDRISPPVFEIIPGPDKTVRDFRSETAHIKPILRSALNLSNEEYEELVESRFGKLSFITEEIADNLIELAKQGINALVDEINALVELIENYKMPRELWNPSERPKNFNQFLQDLASKIDKKIDKVLETIQKFPDLDFSDFIKKIPSVGPLSLLKALLNDANEMTKRIQSIIDGLMRWIKEIARFIKDNKPDAIDSFNTLIGYISGFWDGIVDVVVGIFQLLSLGLNFLKIQLGGIQDVRINIQLLLEAVDQIIRAFDRVDWEKFWKHVKDEIFPKLKAELEIRLDDLINEIARDSAAVGYYYGYLIYNIIETFFPPLKIAKVSGPVAKTARYFRKALQL